MPSPARLPCCPHSASPPFLSAVAGPGGCLPTSSPVILPHAAESPLLQEAFPELPPGAHALPWALSPARWLQHSPCSAILPTPSLRSRLLRLLGAWPKAGPQRCWQMKVPSRVRKHQAHSPPRGLTLPMVSPCCPCFLPGRLEPLAALPTSMSPPRESPRPSGPSKAPSAALQLHVGPSLPPRTQVVHTGLRCCLSLPGLRPL